MRYDDMSMIDVLTVCLFVVGAVWIFVVLLAYRKELTSKASQAISKLSGLSETGAVYTLSEPAIEFPRGQRMGYAEPVLFVFALAILIVVGVRAFSRDTLVATPAVVSTGAVEAKLISGYVVKDRKVDKNQFEDALSKIKEQPSLVTYLRLEDINFSDLREIAHLVHLESLNLDGTLVEELRPITHLEGLRALDLAKTPFHDASQLEYFPNLEWLDLSETKLYDFESLKKLVNLQNLELRNLDFEDLSPLSSLKKLKKLDLSQTKVVDIKPLSKLTQLEELNLSSTNVRDLEPLYGLFSLATLDLSGTKIQNLETLYNLSSLKILDLSETSVDADQIERLRLRLTEGGHTDLEVRVSPGWGTPKREPIS